MVISARKWNGCILMTFIDLTSMISVVFLCYAYLVFFFFFLHLHGTWVIYFNFPMNSVNRRDQRIKFNANVSAKKYFNIEICKNSWKVSFFNEWRWFTLQIPLKLCSDLSPLSILPNLAHYLRVSNEARSESLSLMSHLTPRILIPDTT